MFRALLVASLVSVVIACSASAPPPSVSPTGTAPASPSPSVPPSQLPTAAPTQAAFSCPVTVPNANPVPWGEQPSPLHHGNGKLWTVLWPNETVLIPFQNVDEDGVLWMKFPWWRGSGVRGPLRIEGKRLDAPAAPLKAGIPDGYGEIGFQPSGLGFSKEGCWQVTGSAGSAKLMFVTRVVQSG